MFAVGREQKLWIGDKNYRLCRLTVGLLAQFVEWVDEHLPHPLELLEPSFDLLPAEAQHYLLSEALKLLLFRLDVYGPVAAIRRTDEGQAKLFEFLLDKHHPALTPAQCQELYHEAKKSHDISLILERAEGQFPPDRIKIERAYMQGLGVLPLDVHVPGPEPLNWHVVYNNLFESGFLPHQVNDMTLPELVVCVKPQNHKMLESDKLEHLTARRRLSPRQKLTMYNLEFGHRMSK